MIIKGIEKIESFNGCYTPKELDFLNNSIILEIYRIKLLYHKGIHISTTTSVDIDEKGEKIEVFKWLASKRDCKDPLKHIFLHTNDKYYKDYVECLKDAVEYALTKI